jgi:hypothetical protein
MESSNLGLQPEIITLVLRLGDGDGSRDIVDRDGESEREYYEGCTIVDGDA